MRMTVTLVLSAIVAPALFWTGYFYYKDRFQPEPLLKFGASYILGFVSALGCLKLYELLALAGVPNVLSARLPAAGGTGVLAGLFLAGPVEEFCKFLPFRLVTLRYREFDEKTDGIVYASAVALGFASFENLGYLGYLGGFALFGRALASPLTHAVFASVWGYAVGSAKVRGKRLFPAALGGLILSALIHGVFNVLTTSAAWRLAGALLILTVWLWIIRKFETPRKSQSLKWRKS